MVKISVILSIHSTNFEESLKSILDQTIDEIEIICINNTERNISNVLKRYNKKNISVLNQNESENLLNKSIELSKGEYLAFLDEPNYFLEKNALSKMYSFAKEKNTTIVGSNYKILNDLSTMNEFEEICLIDNDKEMTNIPSDEYKINTPLSTIIIKKSFLEENNIKFSNLDIKLDKIFFARIISKLKDITIINTFLYCKKISTEYLDCLELNSIENKEEYIKQYVDIFEIFKNHKLLNEYKKEFVDYMSFKENLDNEDIRNIFNVHQIDNYFNEKDYGYLIIDSINNPLKTKNEDYFIIKECLFEQNMLENNVIEVNLLKEYLNISKKNNKYNSSRYSMKKLKSMNDFNYKNNIKIVSKINQLNNDNKRYLNINKAVLSSNSWRFTKPLRLIKKLIHR
ncbi:MAG: glycosyltransferase family 2 protein [Methanosphaera stadtmanae]|nr:glycosyltransferase family 2 protein [Methanosphaera stadtmanae]